MTTFGWCSGPDGARVDHEACPGETHGQHGILTCACSCHGEPK